MWPRLSRSRIGCTRASFQGRHEKSRHARSIARAPGRATEIRSNRTQGPCRYPTASRGAAPSGLRTAKRFQRPLRPQRRREARIRKAHRLPEGASRLHHRPHCAARLRRCRRTVQHAVANGGGSQGEGPRRTEGLRAVDRLHPSARTMRGQSSAIGSLSMVAIRKF